MSRRAKKFGWLRDGSKLKRAQIRAHYAGRPEPGFESDQQTIAKAVAIQARQDINDMDDALESARIGLRIVRKVLVLAEENDQAMALFISEGKNLKTLGEANSINTQLIRKIRELDRTIPAANLTQLDEEDIAILKRFTLTR
jgi:hypothetical protein